MSDAVVDGDAHINEDPLAWSWLHERHPGWLSGATSAGRIVAGIEGRAYPLQEGPGCGVPIDSALHPACQPGAFDLDQRIADMDAEGIDVQVLYGGLSLGLTGFADPGFAADFARQCWFSFECEDPFLALYVEHFGPQGALFASDYPHWDAEWPGCVATARQAVEPLGAEAGAALLGDNARRFYALGPGASGVSDTYVTRQAGSA